MLLGVDSDVAFNPSGGYHHAHASQASGFCYINDVVLACMSLADAGKRVLLLDIDAHHCDAVQEAFFDNFAIQCGYCSPGMILVSKALLERNPHPTRDEIAEAIAGNVCRCTGYQSIFAAIEDAALRMNGQEAVAD